MSEVAQLQDDLREELHWALRNGYDIKDAIEIVDAYKDENPGYSNWFDEVYQEFL